MNPRIREFAEQCTTIEHGVIQPRSRGDVYHFDKEKFAKLIVQECSKVNNQFIGHRIGEIDLDLIYKEHFGVK